VYLSGVILGAVLIIPLFQTLTHYSNPTLDIDSGWGCLALYLAEMTGADVTGVTLSTEQLHVANARASEERLSNSAKFLLQDYRDVRGRFHRIVSVGMFEHVGIAHYDTFFNAAPNS
jgi:cyclopropane-fatty-acyl-phospholipid synthase